MVKIHDTDVARYAVKEYKTYITSVEKKTIETFLTEDELKIKHSDAEKKALDYFEENQMGDDKSNSSILILLQKVG